MDDMAEKIQALLSDEESMRQIKELAEMFGGQSAEHPEISSPNQPQEEPDGADGLFGGLDPTVLMQAMDAFSRSDPNCDVILALRPLLSRDKQLKADRAVKILKLLNVCNALKEQGLLNDLL